MATTVAPAFQQTPQSSLMALPPHRIDAFRRAVAARLRAGAEVSVLVAEQQALVSALGQDAFVHAMAVQFQQEMAVQQPNAEYASTHENAMREMRGILQNRIKDAQGFIALLSSPEFMATARAEAQQPAPAEVHYDLPEVKKEEIIRRLVQPNDVAGPEPMVHVEASALGQRVVHQALANVFRPSGNLRAPLVHALATAWPSATGEQLEALAGSWLKARHDPAHSTADGLKQDGPLFVEAMRRAQLLATAPARVTDTPTPQIAAATNTKTTKLADENSLMMDSF